MQVYMEKRGLDDDEFNDPENNFLLDLGLQLEPIIARLYERNTGRELLIPEVVVHPEHPELRGTPDRMVVNELRGVELKTENQFSDQFGAPGTDEVPPHYLIQCAHYMMLTGAFHWDLAVLHGSARFEVYTIQRDAELESLLIERLTEWWNRHIVHDIPPDVDSSDAWKVYLHKRFPKNILPIEEIAPEHSHLVENLRRVHLIQNQVQDVRQEIENKLKGIIAYRDGLTSRYGRVTWKNTKDSNYIDWESAFHTLAMRTGATSDGTAERVQQEQTKIKPGVRRFLFTAPKERTHGNDQPAATIDISAIIGKAQIGDSQSAAETPDSGSNGTDRTHQLPAKPDSE